jgi:hypothetical protein
MTLPSRLGFGLFLAPFHAPSEKNGGSTAYSNLSRTLTPRKSLYSSSRLVTVGLLSLGAPLGQKLLRSEIA